jgi:hypothetical protein
VTVASSSAFRATKSGTFSRGKLATQRKHRSRRNVVKHKGVEQPSGE